MLREKRRLAIKLRREGKSYREIREKIIVSKGTLCVWLKDYPLTQEQITKLTKRYKEKQVERYRETVRKRNESRLLKTYNEEKENLLPITTRELLLSGLFLYLGEGAKVGASVIRVSNTDPNVLKFVLYWYINILKIPKEKIKIDLQLYRDMDADKIKNFWSSWLEIPLVQFRKPYIKKTDTKSVDHSGFKYGTCGISFYDVRLKEKIMMSMKAILDEINIGRIV